MTIAHPDQTNVPEVWIENHAIPGDNGEYISLSENIAYRVQPIFRQYTTHISPGRATRPNGNGHKYGASVIARGFIDIITNNNPLELLRMDVEGLENIVDTSMARAEERLKDQLLAEKRAKCDFCYPRLEDKTSKPRIYHPGLFIENFNGNLRESEGHYSDKQVVSFPSIRAGGYKHHVTVCAMHKEFPNQISYADMFNYIESGFQLANHFNQFDNVNGMIDIINLGPGANASQPHLHAQRTPLIIADRIETDIEAEILNDIKRRTGVNAMDEFIGEVINGKYRSLYIHDDENVVLFAPYAPMYNHQVNIVLKKPRAHILQLSPTERRDVSRSMLGALHFLYEKLGVTDLNLEVHQDRFDCHDDSAMRMFFYILPRNLNKEGGFEKMRYRIITEYPEKTAEQGRIHYKHAA